MTRSDGWVGARVDMDVNVDADARVMVNVAVAEGMKRGVGERIAGRADGGTTCVAMDRGIYLPLHATSRRINTVTVMILIMIFIQLM